MEKLGVNQVFKKFPPLYGSGRFIMVFTRTSLDRLHKEIL
jgi:hypothetical protein